MRIRNTRFDGPLMRSIAGGVVVGAFMATRGWIGLVIGFVIGALVTAAASGSGRIASPRVGAVDPRRAQLWPDLTGPRMRALGSSFRRDLVSDLRSSVRAFLATNRHRDEAHLPAVATPPAGPGRGQVSCHSQSLPSAGAVGQNGGDGCG